MLPQGELSADTPGHLLDCDNYCSFSWIIVAELFVRAGDGSDELFLMIGCRI